MASTHLYCISHKHIDLPDVAGMQLLQVGSEEATFGDLRDNEGRHISERNDIYSELTGHYYIWNNRVSENVGFCHYRRFLLPPGSKDWLNRVKPKQHGGSGYRLPESTIMERLRETGNTYVEGFEPLLQNADIILPRSAPLRSGGMFTQYLTTHDAAPLFRALALIAEENDRMAKAAYHIMNRATHAHWNNMFIARWDLFDRYCQFLFPLLEKLEREIKLPESPYQRRVCAFLSERLFNVWMAHNRVRASLVDWCIVEESLTAEDPHHFKPA